MNFGFNKNHVMPPKQRLNLPEGVTKRQTRVDTQRAQAASCNSQLVRKLSRRVKSHDNNASGGSRPEAQGTNGKEDEVGNSDRVEELTEVIASLNGEIAKLKTYQAQLEKEIAGSGLTSRTVTQGLGKGKEVEVDNKEEEIYGLLTDALQNLSNRTEPENPNSEIKGIGLTAEEISQLDKARTTYKPFDYTGKEANLC
jgi:hypothetical protein